MYDNDQEDSVIGSIIICGTHLRHQPAEDFVHVVPAVLAIVIFDLSRYHMHVGLGQSVELALDLPLQADPFLVAGATW